MKCPHCKKEIGEIKAEDTLGKILRTLNSEEFGTKMFHSLFVGGFSAASIYGVMKFTGLSDYIESLWPLSGWRFGLYLLFSGGLVFFFFKGYAFLFRKLFKWKDPFKD